jgi:hypothetical protein
MERRWRAKSQSCSLRAFWSGTWNTICAQGAEPVPQTMTGSARAVQTTTLPKSLHSSFPQILIPTPSSRWQPLRQDWHLLHLLLRVQSLLLTTVSHGISSHISQIDLSPIRPHSATLKETKTRTKSWQTLRDITLATGLVECKRGADDSCSHAFAIAIERLGRLH